MFCFSHLCWKLLNLAYWGAMRPATRMPATSLLLLLLGISLAAVDSFSPTGPWSFVKGRASMLEKRHVVFRMSKVIQDIDAKELQNMARKELQSLAKENGVKANLPVSLSANVRINTA